ncbi:MAG: ATP-binding protein [Mycoplasmatales bacterium]|nr:ATP-binding protein [Mycoplasmatales bacterium]
MTKQEIIDKALAIPRVAARVLELKINLEQLESGMIILLEILTEQEQEIEPKYITSFNLAPDGSLVMSKILSERGKKLSINDNIITQTMSPINENISFEDMDQTRERIEFGLFFKKFKQEVAQETNPKGFFLYGKMGIGKSFIAQAMANTLAKSGHKVAFLNVAELVSIIKSKFKTGYEEFLEDLRTVDYLFLDDIGAETITAWFRDDILLGILSTRMNNKKTTFFTSNYSMEELEKIESRTQGAKYPDKAKSARLMERIKALSISVSIGGPNRRY